MMDSDHEIAYDYSPRFRIYKNGQIQRLVTETFVPPSLTPVNGVVSKDAVYSREKNLSLRIYLPHHALETGDEKKKGVEDPWIDVVGSDLSGLGCGRVFVMVAGKDVLAMECRVYAEKLGWECGRVEVVETKDEDHVFHIRNPDSDNARLLVQRFAEFLRQSL